MKNLEPQKKLLKEEWMYCMRMIQDRINEVDEINLENYQETIEQQFQIMAAVRNLVGKTYHFMTDERLKKIYKNDEKIKNTISKINKALDEIELR